MNINVLLGLYLNYRNPIHDWRFTIKDNIVVNMQPQPYEPNMSQGSYDFINTPTQKIHVGIFSLAQDNPPYFTNQIFRQNFNLILGNIVVPDQDCVRFNLKKGWLNNTLTVRVNGDVVFCETYKRPILKEFFGRIFSVFDDDFAPGYEYVSVDIVMHMLRMVKMWRPNWIETENS